MKDVTQPDCFFVVTHVFVVYRQEHSFVLLAGHCTGRHFYLHVLCADVCLGFGCRQCEMLTRMKNRIIHYALLSATIFDILHSNRSNQVKF